MTPQPHGTWPSPITPEALLAGARTLAFPEVFEGRLYWMEGTPEEKGRTTVQDLSLAAGGLIPAPFNVRSRVHEYGGRAFAVIAGRALFVNFQDQRLYAQPLAGGDAVALTADDGARWGECVPDSQGRGLWLVGEREQNGKTDNFLALHPLSEGALEEPEVVASGHDFYASPAPSPDGRCLAYLAWDQGEMPWDGAVLYRQRLTPEGRPEGDPVAVAGGQGTSVFQPGWAPEGALLFMDDRTGWWNLYEQASEGEAPRACLPRAAEFGLPLWQLGMRSWCFIDDQRIACLWFEEGHQELGVLTGAAER